MARGVSSDATGGGAKLVLSESPSPAKALAVAASAAKLPEGWAALCLAREDAVERLTNLALRLQARAARAMQSPPRVASPSPPLSVALSPLRLSLPPPPFPQPRSHTHPHSPPLIHTPHPSPPPPLQSYTRSAGAAIPRSVRDRVAEELGVLRHAMLELVEAVVRWQIEVTLAARAAARAAAHPRRTPHVGPASSAHRCAC